MNFYTPPQIAKMLHVRRTKVLTWIRSGKLRAINVSTGSRPSYRISQQDFDTFLALMRVQPPTPRTRRPPVPKDYTEYY